MKRFLLFLSALLLLGGCRRAAEHDTIRIGMLQGPSAVSFIQMIDQPTPVDGHEVRLIMCSDPMQMQALMLKGEVDFAVLPTVMAANLYNKGAGFRMAACPIWGTLYLLSGDEAIRTPEDLNGHSVAIFGQGTTADVLTKRMIRRERLEHVDRDYRFTSNQAVAQALLAGQTKAAVLSEPLVSILLDAHPHLHVVKKLDCDGSHFEDSPRNYFVQSAFVVSRHMTDHHPQRVAKVCDAYRNSCNFINKQPDQAARLLARHKLTPNEAVARRSIDLCNIQYVASFALVRELYHYLQVCHTENPDIIGGKLPDEDFIY